MLTTELILKCLILDLYILYIHTFFLNKINSCSSGFVSTSPALGWLGRGFSKALVRLNSHAFGLTSQSPRTGLYSICQKSVPAVDQFATG